MMANVYLDSNIVIPLVEGDAARKSALATAGDEAPV